MTDIYSLNKANYTAVTLLDELGISEPTQAQIDAFEELLGCDDIASKKATVVAKLLSLVERLDAQLSLAKKNRLIEGAVEAAMDESKNDLLSNLLKRLGIASPTQAQHKLIEEMVLGMGFTNGLKSMGLLTVRQKECLYWAAQGYNANETARQMKIDTTTVQSHRGAIKSNLGCKNMAHAVYKWSKLHFVCEPCKNEVIDL